MKVISHNKITLEVFSNHFSDVGTFAHHGSVYDGSRSGEAAYREETYIRSNFPDGTSITTRGAIRFGEDEEIIPIFITTIAPFEMKDRSWISIDTYNFDEAEKAHRYIAGLIEDGVSLSEAVQNTTEMLRIKI